MPLRHRARLVAPLLRDEHHDLRVAALGLLGKMRAEPLAPHAAGLVLCLEDATSAAVREAAVELLARHAAALLSPHADAIAERTRHADAKTRYAALDALSRHPSVRAARLADVVARLDDREAFRHFHERARDNAWRRLAGEPLAGLAYRLDAGLYGLGRPATYE